MHVSVVQRLLGLVLTMFSLTMLPPVAVSLGYADGQWQPFMRSFGILLVIGLALWLPVRRVERDLRLRDGFLVVALFWIVLAVAGAAPLLLGDRPHLAFTDAVFEAASGITTTSATVLDGLDRLPKSVLWYRQQLQWLGGVGIIVLAVALFPVLGIGGMQLYKSETPGPVKEEKLTPRLTQTARALWGVYALLTAACTVSYALAGMGWFDALAHAFSTVSTGGFSPYDAGLAHFHSYAIDMVAIVFMFFGAANFALHFVAWRNKDAWTYLRDPQFRAYLYFTLALIALVTGYLLVTGTYTSTKEAFRHGAFEVVSMLSTTGFAGTNFAAWPGMLPPLLILLTFVGGCSGSTAGGMKVIRWQLVLKQSQRELTRLVHPSAALPVKFADRPVPGRVLAAVTGFFAIYLVLFGLMMLFMMATGLDQVTAWSAVAACINNAGPGLGDVAANYRIIPDAAKWACIIAMLIGRLEVFTLVVLFTPTFWRH
ncbi:MAG TPA: TrkH family potassium uptake protein [Steroidobacteraceae bacterium]|nr:TrkH family potassium uptake protein [Steroidobacteraceae bacterium]